MLLKFILLASHVLVVVADDLATRNNVAPRSNSTLAIYPRPLLSAVPSPIEPVLGAVLASNPKIAVQPKQINKKKIKLPQPKLTQQFPQLSPSTRLDFNQDDPIITLDYSSISNEILRKPTANFIFFNANFNNCRHCQKFYHNWRELALDIRWWRQVIKLYTINCSDEDNMDMCKRAGVTQFPQVRYYWVMSDSLNQDGQRLRILGKSVHAMRHMVMDKVRESYLEHNKMLEQRNNQQKQVSIPNQNGPTTNPLTTLVTIMGQLIGPLQAPATAATTSAPSQSASNPISVILGNLISGTGNGTSSSAASPLSLGNLMNMFGGFQGISQIINFLMKASSMRKSLAVQPLPGNWPQLESIEGQTLSSEGLLDLLPLSNLRQGIGALLIMETQEFLYTGLEVLLDLSPYGNTTYFVRVRDDRSILTSTLSKDDEIKAPALIYVSELREPRLIVTAPKYTNDEDLRRIFVRSFERKQIKYPVRRVWAVPFEQRAIREDGGKSSEENEDILGKVDKVYMNDLTNAVRISLMDQVFRHSDLSDEQYNALVKYIYALVNYFPFQEHSSLKFLIRLQTWLQNQVSPIYVEEYKKQFHDVDEFLPKLDWVACKSLSNLNTIPSRSRSKNNFVLENPDQLGKVVSNITRLFRSNQEKINQLKGLIGMLTSSSTPVMLSKNKTRSVQSSADTATRAPLLEEGPAESPKPTSPSTTKPPKSGANKRSQNEEKKESPLERLFKSLTSGSLGSDSSILKLISTLTGGRLGDSATGEKSKFAREYPCGAWKLAHVMVINEYIRDSPRKDVKHIVLQSLYQYMLNFYACSACGNRVSDVSGEFRLNLDENLKDQADSIMLLWKVHNRVNKRLEGEIRIGSPPKQQFPSELLCPKCRVSKEQGDSAGAISAPLWHERQVLNYLVYHYRPQSIVSNSTSSKLLSSSSTASATHLSLNLIFSWCLFSTLVWSKQASAATYCLVG